MGEEEYRYSPFSKIFSKLLKEFSPILDIYEV
jgi:hypothetical protein